jgi:hypothetical protein
LPAEVVAVRWFVVLLAHACNYTTTVLVILIVIALDSDYDHDSDNDIP